MKFKKVDGKPNEWKLEIGTITLRGTWEELNELVELMSMGLKLC